ncbi:hypothetical protein [Rhodopirellula sp. SWK7]|uniref:hypothetical protein n=1 Tax=Rhodopirellula sp. SWK7 TaxID=595460 RepID=UPI0002BEB250|nr:hypothetical protein [Rhodopirellula sp. SWK7]EMI45606.1 hypothetical protein RRSWK_02010 [Rhodopirellula sp. SWK7]
MIYRPRGTLLERNGLRPSEKTLIERREPPGFTTRMIAAQPLAEYFDLTGE